MIIRSYNNEVHRSRRCSGAILSSSFLSKFLAWVILPGVYASASMILRAIKARTPRHHVEIVAQREGSKHLLQLHKCQLRNRVQSALMSRDGTNHRNEKLCEVSALGHAQLTVLILRRISVEWSQFCSIQGGVHFLCWGFTAGWVELIPVFVQMPPSFLPFRLVPSFAHIALFIYFLFLLQKRMPYFRLEV
jgi:hypothetical protein